MQKLFFKLNGSGLISRFYRQVENRLKKSPKVSKNIDFIAVICATAIAVGNIAVTPIAVFRIPTAM